MKTFASILTMFVLLAIANAAEPPKPFGPVPSERQLRWHQLQFYCFIHFTVNTFTDKEWGYGDEAETIFAPTKFDANQIVRTAKEAGMRGLVLTCKHHDGFCLWPSAFTEHSVKNCPWRKGKGDMVKEFAAACRRHGLKFGVYLSPWDRNHKDYATPAYITYYRSQLRELLTNYGEVFEMWFDGANGGDGFYGGAREKRKIDNRTYYDWDNTWKIVRELQPFACMFSDGGPDVRWVGNERGFAGETCWAAMTREGLLPGHADPKLLNVGQRDGKDWLPAEVDVSIRPGWFYHGKEDAKVKTPEQLVKIYFESVGRGANLILNLPPDRRGIIHENDVKSLRGMRRILDKTFAKDLARGAKVTASNVRGGDETFGPARLVNKKHTGFLGQVLLGIFGPAKVTERKQSAYWSTDDAVTTPELTLEWKKPVTFDVAKIAEDIRLGQRVDEFALDQWKDGAWQEFAKATSIGPQRLLRFEPVTTAKLRLRITKSPACPAITEFGLFKQP